MKIIRKRLYASEGLPSNVRWNIAGGYVEATFDEGETWHESEPNDPRRGEQFRSPVSTEEGPKCHAATGMVGAIEDTLNHVYLASSLIDMANAILALITVTVPGFGLLVRVIFLFCEAMVAIGIAAIQIEMTEEVFGDLLCVFLDEIGDDGSMTDAQLEAVNTRVCSEFSVTVCAVVGAVLNLWGAVGMSNIGAAYDGDVDCSDCEKWCYVFDFSIDDYSEYFYPRTPVTEGAYSAGNGWENGTDASSHRLVLQAYFPFVFTATDIRLEFDYVRGSDDASPDDRGGLTRVGNGSLSNTIATYTAPYPSGSYDQLSEGSWAMNSFEFNLWASNVNTPPPDGSVLLYRVTFQGFGDNPFGDDNC